jgi:hypothetical protein
LLAKGLGSKTVRDTTHKCPRYYSLYRPRYYSQVSAILLANSQARAKELTTAARREHGLNAVIARPLGRSAQR